MRSLTASSDRVWVSFLVDEDEDIAGVLTRGLCANVCWVPFDVSATTGDPRLMVSPMGFAERVLSPSFNDLTSSSRASSR